MFFTLWIRTLRALQIERKAHKSLQKRVTENLIPPAYLAHEIRTPLTVIQGAAEILINSTSNSINDSQQQFLSTIYENSANACNLAEDFLTFFNMEKSLAKLQPRKIELRQLMREAVYEFRIMHTGDTRLDNRGAPIYIEADPQLMKQVIWNLLTNSFRHGGKNPHVIIRVSATDGTALIVVEDTLSAHLPKTKIPPIETDFIPHTSLPQSGSGIGMEIVQRIVDAHNGTLIVDRKPGTGQNVYLQLPLHKQNSQWIHMTEKIQ